jgi:Family of unknown function (DUF6157)
MNYFNTFIEVAEDCKAQEGTPPKTRPGAKTIAELEFELVSSRPYSYTQEDVQFHVHAVRSELSKEDLKANGDTLRKEFFAKPMACMRTSPLPKTYGWGLHFNEAGLLALVPVGSPGYKKLAKASGIEHTRAMRSKKA